MDHRVTSWREGMMMHGLPRHAKMIRMSNAADAPPRFVEHAYYALVFYAIMGPALGLSVDFLGAGALATLAAFCIMRLGSRAIGVYTPFAFPLGCAISYLAVQVIVHGESLMEPTLRWVVTWLMALIVVWSLSLRQGFLHRFALATFVIGLALLPYLRLGYVTVAGYERAGLDSTVGLSNPNDLAAWFGFCSVYFIIAGIETKRTVICTASWLSAVGCLYIVSLTVSRGALLAVAIAATIALRHLLKRSFLPVLLLMLLSWISYESGLFERAITSYAARGTEETGRFLVWPLAAKRFLSSPLTGVGAAKIATYVPQVHHSITPHNGFLAVALASGVVPLTFFVAYWWGAAWGAFRSSIERTADAPFQAPLLVYTFLITLDGNFSFTFPWAVVTLSTALAASAPRQVRRIVAPRVGRHGTVGHSGRQGEAGYGVAR